MLYSNQAKVSCVVLLLYIACRHKLRFFLYFWRFFVFLAMNKNNSYRIHLLLVSFAWCIGLIAGSLFATYTTTIHNSLTQMLSNSHLSVLGFVALQIFPFLLSAFLLRMFDYKAIIPLIICKAFSFGFCACFFIAHFDYSGWLLRWLFLFSDSVSSVFLIWFWIRCVNGYMKRRQNDLMLCIIFVLIIGFIDSYYISPFGISLLSYS